ncbi:hypothetical protein [Dyadobacter sp. LHD-138]|uniref:hypothetical protein n=1 Tax=Dyadobacter sp. LHD-138 TaxID=3071413 RepID=UPI0027E0F47B|nr:hypothetical protein [Dyadobacter sp. LHD-138]MDQ6481670.1 hypothetical protein [Dyadobacter sp. LHD-138]
MRSIYTTSLILNGFLLESTAFAQRKFAFPAIVAPFYGIPKPQHPSYSGSMTGAEHNALER